MEHPASYASIILVLTSLMALLALAVESQSGVPIFFLVVALSLLTLLLFKNIEQRERFEKMVKKGEKGRVLAAELIAAYIVENRYPPVDPERKEDLRRMIYSAFTTLVTDQDDQVEIFRRMEQMFQK